MKNILVFLGAMVLLTSSALGQKKVAETSFWVGGVCDMCKQRIEKTLDVKGVKYASYDLSTHTLTVAYKTKKISEDRLHELLNAVGHDTAKSKATDEAYDKVHGCCKYRDHNHGHGHDHDGEDDHDHDGEDDHDHDEHDHDDDDHDHHDH